MRRSNFVVLPGSVIMMLMSQWVDAQMIFNSNPSSPFGHAPNIPTDTNYAFSKQLVANTKSLIHPGSITKDSLSGLFSDLLTKHIIPHWLSTPWSFEGHTAVPREGTIACGYFVSTTLRDMGFNLNRYTFAQQLPVNEAKTLSMGKVLIEINNPSTAERIQQLQTHLQEGIYFIGFDQSHVGYIHKKNGELFVIHSNYINAEGVVNERIEDSEVFSYYTRIYIAEISTNRDLLKKWLGNEPIYVVTE